MLVLTRKIGESITVGDDIKITVVEVKGKQVQIGIAAPPEVRIYREEIFKKVQEENKKAANQKNIDLSVIVNALIKGK